MYKSVRSIELKRKSQVCDHKSNMCYGKVGLNEHMFVFTLKNNITYWVCRGCLSRIIGELEVVRSDVIFSNF